jgi:hypothetical protein
VVAKAMVVIFMFLFCRGKQNALCEQKQPERNVFAFQLALLGVLLIPMHVKWREK